MKKLQQYRQDRGLTQEEASKLLEITKEYLSMIERGAKKPSDNIRQRMSKVYKAPIDEIFLSSLETYSFKKE